MYNETTGVASSATGVASNETSVLETVAQHYNQRVDVILGLTLFAMALFGWVI